MDSLATPSATAPENLRTSDRQPAHRATVDDGLRSAPGIRWLLLVGALVVAVSAVRLVAARWGTLPMAVQFLVLVAGTLGVYGLGELARQRLRLPVAGAALNLLFAVLVPVLAWGAAYVELVRQPAGGLALGLGLVALLVAARRLLASSLGYRGGPFAVVAALLVAALPVLPQLAAHGQDLLLVLAVVLGLLLRIGSRDINRFFFHRDRRDGVDRPVHLLPFLLLALVYGAGFATSGGVAVLALALIGVAWIDSGEEYYRAWCRAGGAERPWPRRSRGLLAVGFSVLVASWVLALFAGAKPAAVIVMVAAWRLLAWGWRHRDRIAWSGGLTALLFAYHLVPALFPASWLALLRRIPPALGLETYSASTLSLADLGALALFVALGFGVRRYRDAALGGVQAIAVALLGVWTLSIGWDDVAALAWIAPLVGLLLKVAVVALRRRSLIVVLYLAFATSVVAGAVVAGGWPAALPALGMAGLISVGAAWATLGSAKFRHFFGLRDEELDGWTGVALGPPLASAVVVLLSGFERAYYQPWSALGMLAMATATVLLAGVVIARRHRRQVLEVGGWLILPWLAFAALQIWVSGWLTIVGGSAAWAALGLAAAGFGLGRWLDRREHGAAALGRAAALFLTAVAVVCSFIASTSGGGSTWWVVLPAFGASLGLALVHRGIAAPVWRACLASFSALSFAAATTALLWRLEDLGAEFYCLGPGVALLGLSRGLHGVVGERWRQRLFTAGASCLYAMPAFGLADGLSWGWQGVLLVLALGFGAVSFRLRSRSLLYVSTGAAAVSLACFLIKLHQAAPLLLWLTGLVLGLGLMASAAFLEYRREVLLQRLRLWGADLRSWA